MPKRSRDEKASAKAKPRMKYDRDALIRLFSQANKAKDMSKSYALYCQILETSHLDEYLERKVIADIYFNRALNNAEIAAWYQGEHGFTGATTHIIESLEDMKQAQKMYLAGGRVDDAAICSGQIELFQKRHDEIIPKLTESAAKIPVLAPQSFFKGHGGILVSKVGEDAESESKATASSTSGGGTSLTG